MKNFSLAYITTCATDYFSGYHLPVVQVLVDCETTIQDLADSLNSADTYDHLPEEITSENYKQAVLEYFTTLFLNWKTLPVDEDSKNFWNLKWDSSLESMEDYEEYDVYSYFCLEEIENED